MFILNLIVLVYMEGGKLFFALMYKDKSVFEKAVQLLKDDFGAILSSSAEYGFYFTDYYKEEFGTDLKKMLTYLTTLNFLKYLCSCPALKTRKQEKNLRRPNTSLPS